MNQQKIVDLLRHQRHDFANHLQVIGGYLELNQADKALTYLKQVIRELELERSLFQLESGISLFLYQQFMRWKEQGIGVILGQVCLGEDSKALLFRNQEAINDLIQGLVRGNTDDEWSEVRLDIEELEDGVGLKATIFSKGNTMSNEIKVR